VNSENPNVEITPQQEPKNQNNNLESLISAIRDIIKPILDDKEYELDIKDFEEILQGKDIGRIAFQLLELKSKPIADQMIQSIDSVLNQIRLFFNPVNPVKV
jgi:hypothetical protein